VNIHDEFDKFLREVVTGKCSDEAKASLEKAFVAGSVIGVSGMIASGSKGEQVKGPERVFARHVMQVAKDIMELDRNRN
jgi:hypothetical protein